MPPRPEGTCGQNGRASRVSFRQSAGREPRRQGPNVARRRESVPDQAQRCMPSFAREGRAHPPMPVVAPGHPWSQLSRVMVFRTVWVWSGNVAAGANEAVIACPLVRQTSLVASLEARDAHPGRREPSRIVTIGDPEADRAGVTPTSHRRCCPYGGHPSVSPVCERHSDSYAN